MAIRYVDIETPEKPKRTKVPAAELGPPKTAPSTVTSGKADAGWYRSALAQLGLSHAEAAALFGFSRQASNQWATGTRAIPPYIEGYVRLAVAVGRSEVERIRAELA